MASISLTEEQKRYITMPPGMDVIISVAGSGKTTVLSNRIAHLIETGFCKPEQILVFSYTRKASEEITKRVKNILNLKPREKGPIASTIHTFCKNEVCEYIGLENATILADFADIKAYEVELLSNIYSGELDKYFKEYSEIIKSFLRNEVINNDRFIDIISLIVSFDINNYNTYIANNQNNLLVTEEIHFRNALESYLNALHAAAKLPRDLASRSPSDRFSFVLKLMSEGITSYMTMNGVFTFDTMIASFLAITDSDNHPEYVFSIMDRFKHIVVDEFQDVKPLEMQAIHRISSLIGSCTHAGDYAQTLYNDIQQFTPTGAHGSIYSNDQYKMHTMTQGFRVPDPICETSNYLRKLIYNQISIKDKELNKNEMIPAPHQHGSFEIKYLIPPYKIDNRTAFNIIVSDFIDTYLPTHYYLPEESICIMNKTNREVRVMSEVIRDRGEDSSVKYTYERTDKNLQLLQIYCLYYLFYHGTNVSTFITAIRDKIKETIGRLNRMINNIEENYTTLVKLNSLNTEFNKLFRAYKLSFGQIHRLIAEEMNLEYTPTLIERMMVNAGSNTNAWRNLFTIFDHFDHIINKTKSRDTTTIKGKIKIASQKITKPFLQDPFIKGFFHPNQRKGAIRELHKWKHRMEKAAAYVNSQNPTNINEVIRYMYIYLTKQRKISLDKYKNKNKARLHYMRQAKKNIMKSLTKIVLFGKHTPDTIYNQSGLSQKYNIFDEVTKEALPVTEEDGVIVTDTIHSRKGLEYDHVAIVVPFDDPFVGNRSLKSLCLEYVALTRAKKNCVIYLYNLDGSVPENSIPRRALKLSFREILEYYVQKRGEFPSNCFNSTIIDKTFGDVADDENRKTIFEL